MKNRAPIKRILILIPTHNEVENIEELLTGVEQTAVKHKLTELDILVVDDNSPDGTAKKVKALQNQYNNIELLSGKKEGLGKAYTRGLSFALEHGDYNVFVLMDGDLSHDPKDIPALLKALKTSDYVIGSRYTKGGSLDSNWPAHRRMISRIANNFAGVLIGSSTKMSDLTGGFKAMRAEALKQIDLNRINAHGYVFQVSLLHAFLSHSFRIQEVPITFTNRVNGKSKLRLRDVIEFLYQTYKLNPNAPIQKFVRFGFVGACGSIVNLIVLTMLVQGAGFNPLIAVVLAIEISIIFNFFLNHYYTFKGFEAYPLNNGRQDTFNDLAKKLALFNAGALGGAVISFLVFSLLYKAVHLHYILADIIAILAAMSWNYWMSTRFVWRVIDYN